MSQVFHIAVIDDHKDIRELLVRYLGEHGYRVSAAESVAAFRRQLDTSAPDLLVLDIMMPGDDGLTLCRELRAKSQVPIIFLTAMAEETDRIVGLEMGADDYLTKPFNPRELLARIKAVMRRAQSLPTPTRAAVRAEKIQFEDKVLDVGRREVVEGDGVAVPLSDAEFRLLCVFLERPGVVLSRDQLLDLTSGRPAEVWDRSIDNQVSRLRRKIEADPAQPALIKTCWGDGYQFVGKVRKS
jgi:two-component system, OmpR family, response regulator